jgi:hypothetical protein
MSTISPALAGLAQGVANELREHRERPLEPPAGLPERVLVWLALAPVWTARMAAVCDFPVEADEDDRAARKRLERQASGPDPGATEPVCAAQHALGVMALGSGRLGEAKELLQIALEGHHRLGNRAGAVAAEYHLGDIAAKRDRLDEARTWFRKAGSEETGWADDVSAAVIAGRLARLELPVSKPPVSEPPVPASAIDVTPDLESGALEAARVLERITGSDLCAAALGDAPETEAETGGRLTECRYWMMDVLRQQVVEKVMRDPSRGMQAVQGELQLIGQRIRDAAESGVPILRTMRQWAQLAARAGDIRDMADLLTRECDRLLTFASETEANPSGTALAWIQAAEPLEELLKGELTAALARARRQLDLFHRRRDDDQRYLRHFVERPEQTRAIRDLLSNKSAWALHFVGAGGTGKTMLMRYISSDLGPRRGASTARIDFDYLSPDYPAQKPGMLLAELAEELRLNADDAAFSLFAQFDEQLLKLHEQRTGVRGPTAANNAPTAMEELLRTFSMALAALPPPVILLIDTCEELAKVRPDGTSPEGVVRTFGILLELQRSVPGLKVIFAGRRPLAKSGAGWQVRHGDDDLPDRSYLRLHQILGFTEDEALRYLDSEGVPSELQGPILTQARDRTDPDRFIWADSAQAPAKVDRFSPFELSGWAALGRRREGEHLTPADIVSADSDRYVELRIIRRIRYEPLKLALPALGLVGRCDPALLQAALPELPDFDRMFRELRQQEWISRRGTDFYEMDEGLSRRLLHHFERVQPDEVDRCYCRIAEYLEDRTINDPLSGLLPFHFDTAMRVLQREPRRAARWWAEAEARFVREEQYEWARQLVEFMLGPEGACAEVDRYGARPEAAAALRAAVLATQMSCFTHCRPAADRRAGWLEAESLLPGFPDPELADRLRFRVAAGKIAAGIAPRAQLLPATEPVAVSQLLAPPLVDDPQLAASFIAAVEAAVERAEQETAPGPWLATVTELGAVFTHAIGTAPWSVLTAFAGSLAARIAVLERRFDVAETWFRGSVDLGGDSDRRWLDWRPPDDLQARLMLELVRGMYPARLSASEVLDIMERGSAYPLVTGASPVTADTERLASAELILSAALGLTDPGLDRALQRVIREQPSPKPSCNAHRAFPALATTIAEDMAAAGDVDRALELLSSAGRGWERSSAELESVTHAERAALRIIRRMRLRDEGQGLSTGLAGSTDLADAELLWSLEGLDGAKAARSGTARIELDIPDGADPDAWCHARWRTLSPFAWPAQVIADFAGHRLPAAATRPEKDFLLGSTLLDYLEACDLTLKAGMSSALPDRSRESVARQCESLVENWWRDHPQRPEEALRLLLRTAALSHREPRQAAVPRPLIQRLGRRRAAEIALDEGEMLALRLPERARPIVDLAEEWFSQCGDHVGAVIAETAGALLLVRGGLRNAVADLGTGKTAMDLEHLAFLPSWPELQSLADGFAEAALETLGPPGWRPWLVRIIACQVWASVSASRAVRLRRLQDWIAGHYGEAQLAIPGAAGIAAVAVPAELDRLLDLPSSSGLPRLALFGLLNDLSELRSRWRRVRGLRKRVKLLARFIFGRSALFALISLYLVISLIISPIIAFELSPGGISLWFWAFESPLLITVVIIFGRVFVVARTRRYRPARLSADATLIPATLSVRAGDPRGGTVELSLDSRGQPTRREIIALPAADVPYQQLRSELPDSIRTGIGKILEARRDSQRMLDVRLDQGFGAPCWEAMLTAAGDPDQARASSLRIVRTVGTRRTRPVKAFREIETAVSLVADLRQDEMATQGWRRLIEKRRYSHQIRRPDEVYGDDNSGEEIDVLHVVAAPIDTASGPRLDLGRITGAQLSSRQSGRPRGELMQPADVTRRFPDLVLCVLQATPQERTHRTEAERRQAASLRLMAEEIFSMGVTAVVSIPPLPSSVAAVVLDTLAEAVGKRPARPVAALTKAIKKAREKMPATAGLTDEAAFDICLYATEVQVRPASTPGGGA